MDQPLISRTLGGRFKLTGHIGEGAMASVFRGSDLSRPEGGDVAVKVMHPHLAVDYTFTARFKREAEAASMVKHANSVAILDVGEEQGIHYIVMEALPRARSARHAEGRAPPPRASRGAHHHEHLPGPRRAHQLGVVHRDLKPENVMVEFDARSGTDHVKVLDFASLLVDAQPKARISTNPPDSDPPPALTQMGVVIGTPQYMSPEQCRGQPLDGRSDLYTCGILLYQLTTGVVPFNSESPVEVAGKQAFEAPLPPRTHLPSLDAGLEAIIMKCLSKAPADRPQTASELHEALSQWLTSRGLVALRLLPTCATCRRRCP
jgi:serine/threonine-protein kinase